MRVISQCGKYDLPYERCVVWRNKEKIYACPIGEPESDYQVAFYSTEEKAERAMEMLHEAYTGLIYMKNIEISEEDAEQLKEMLHRGFGTIAYCSNDGSAKIEPMNIVFRFPKEDEIE